ncbi:MAG: sulfite exporter TauE/SafE family protein [Candidatus Omnitrophica bacterium]|nr:sulfite exporter TauE/SafE family protein [Candidatus Omnitrophota bacterium]
MNLANNLDFLAAFGGGVLTSFTPCVYPLIPVIIGVVTARSFGSKIKGLILSVIFTSGTAITYALLGLIAALTGRHFGRISAHPLSYIFVGSVVFIFALFMLDVFRVTLPPVTLRNMHKKNGFLAVFLMGLVLGLAVGPCTAPVLGSILTYAASKQNLLYATLLLISFAYGMGLVLILAGTFSSELVNLPQPGRWMLWVKRILGFLLMGWGLYFIFLGLRRF